MSEPKADPVSEPVACPACGVSMLDEAAHAEWHAALMTTLGRFASRLTEVERETLGGMLSEMLSARSDQTDGSDAGR